MQTSNDRGRSKVMVWKLITEDTVEEDQGEKTETERLGNLRTEIKISQFGGFSQSDIM